MSATAERSEFTKALEQHRRKQLEEKMKLKLMILGESGIGKSTLVNGLIGANVADTATPGFLSQTGITTEVKMYEFKCNNITIKIWDTPALLDPTIDTDKILENVKECEIDLFLFCIRMDQVRYLPENATTKIIAKISEKMGKGVWKKTLIVLTRANMAITIMEFTTPPENVKTVYETVLAGFKTAVTKDIREYSEDSPKFAVAGMYEEDKLFPDDTESWLSAFWAKCFECIDSTTGKFSYKDRLVVEEDKQAKKPDQTKLQDQKMVLSEEFGKNKSSFLSSFKGAVVGLAGFTYSYFKSSSNGDEKK